MTQDTSHHLSICVCTYQRPKWLGRLLDDLGRQNTKDRFTFEVVVADNDAAETGRAVAIDRAAQSPIKIIYCVEPRRSISHVRNQTLTHATGDAIVFIDDDEFPSEEWLFNLFQAWQQSGAAGVLGPVRPSFDENAPAWVKKGGFYDRPEHPTGFLLDWPECRTGNVLFDRRIIAGLDPVFLPEFGTGGGDVDFFRRMMQAGNKFIWCNEAVVFEYVPPNRCKRSVLLKRGTAARAKFVPSSRETVAKCGQGRLGHTTLLGRPTFYAVGGAPSIHALSGQTLQSPGPFAGGSWC